MAKYIPSKRSIPHAKELILKRIELEENCIEKPFDTGEIYALQKAALVMDAYEQGYLVEREKGEWIPDEWDTDDDRECICSCCREQGLAKQGRWDVYLSNFCPHCGAEMSD